MLVARARASPPRAESDDCAQPLIVHDYLLQHGGAERVVDVLMSAYPRAPLVTSLAGPEYRRRYGARLHTSSLQHLPVDRRSFRALMPLYAARLRRSTAAPGRHRPVQLQRVVARSHPPPERAVDRVLPHPGAMAVARRGVLPGKPAAPRPAARCEPLLARLRARDVECAREATHYVANSAAIAARIRRCYRIEASVVHPPVAVERFRCDRPREEFYLVVSRLLDYKRIDLAVEACTLLRRRLLVVGSGPALPRLRALAGPTVSFLGSRSDAQVEQLMERCRALIVGAEEDFGIAAVEAMAAGAAVVALGSGGVAETVTDEHTGILFGQQDVAALVAAIRRLETRDFPAVRQAAAAAPFAAARFVTEMAAEIDAVMGRAAPQWSTPLRS